MKVGQVIDLPDFFCIKVIEGRVVCCLKTTFENIPQESWGDEFHMIR